MPASILWTLAPYGLLVIPNLSRCSSDNWRTKGQAARNSRIASSASGDRSMDIKRVGSQASVKGPAANFTGSVRIDPLFQTSDPARALGVSVTFEPGARTAWHVHPLGQSLIVTAGCGLVQSWGGPLYKIRPGDMIWCPPGEKHWHGATATTAMTHLAIVEQLDGKTVDWLEKVSDEQYRGGLTAG